MRHLLAALTLIASTSLFAQDECDLFNIQELSDAYLNFQVDTIILQPDGSFEVQLSNGTTFTQVQGCTDTSYLEYNASANTDDGSCATLVVEGCTDPAYTEYNASANADDGSCSTAVVEGCTDPAYTEYNAAANTDDGSCATLVFEGCTDPAYIEYDASANTDDGSCSTAVVEGCTDPADVNYNASANIDDGSCASMACSSPEFDGYTYSVVEIGDQCWFAENLRTTTYADGADIPEVTSGGTWASMNSGARCNYGNNASNVATYGRLYNWYAVDDSRGLCPSGWHVPTDGEWTELKDYITSQGFSGTEGTALKSTWGWLFVGLGTDDFGFSALPGGYRDRVGGFESAGTGGFWWSSSPFGDYAWLRRLSNSNPGLSREFYAPRNGFSVRCLKDAD